MLKALKLSVAAFVLAVVLCGVVHAPCRDSVSTETLTGALVGVAHGLVRVYCFWEHNGKRPPLRAIKRMMRHDICMGAVIGLLIGVVSALVEMCGR